MKESDYTKEIKSLFLGPKSENMDLYESLILAHAASQRHRTHWYQQFILDDSMVLK